MQLTIPDFSLVVLIGASGSGKSTFARRHFRPTEVVSSDFCRAMVCDDEGDQTANQDAFAVLHLITARRLARAKLTVIDATNVQAEARRRLLALARQYHCLPVGIVLDLPYRVCEERNRERCDRSLPPHVISRHIQQLRESLRHLRQEGFYALYLLSSQAEIDGVTIERRPLPCNRFKHEAGPYDLIGDVHGCFDELVALLRKLGYQIEPPEQNRTGREKASWVVQPPEGRKVIFLGDLVDRGPKTGEVLRLAMDMTEVGTALYVPGNHEVKLVRALKGRAVQLTYGLAETMAQLQQEPEPFRRRVERFLNDLTDHYVLDDGRLVVAHAGMKEAMQGRLSRQVHHFALYGETAGETDAFGPSVCPNWVAEYRGRALVAYGHTPVVEPTWLNRTVNLDTGCVFGGHLTALRYPEQEIVQVPAARTYYRPARSSESGSG